MDPIFFASADEWRAWLERNHGSASEVLVGYWKKGTGRPSMTWPESVDEALCFGWIDGVRRGIDDERYSIRFTPRKARSTWSQVNVRRARELIDAGLMQPAGLAAFEARDEKRSGIYSYEQRKAAKLPRAMEQEFRANEKAWSFFGSRPPGYRRTAIWWVISAKREDTRKRRLATLIADSAAGRTLRHLTRPGGR